MCHLKGVGDVTSIKVLTKNISDTVIYRANSVASESSSIYVILTDGRKFIITIAVHEEVQKIVLKA